MQRETPAVEIRTSHAGTKKPNATVLFLSGLTLCSLLRAGVLCRLTVKDYTGLHFSGACPSHGGSSAVAGYWKESEQMARVYFDQELQKLQDDLVVFGSMVSDAILDSVKAMRERDVAKAERIVGYDRMLNERRFGIEDRCLTLLATQQPTARDLRLIAGVMEINIELERMGDYAKGISRITTMLGPECTLRIPAEIQQMADKGVDMLRRALDAFVNQDLETAKVIPLEDDEIDTMYNRVNRELIARVMAHPSRSDQLNYISWAAHNLERFGDRVTNICERTMYTITGEFLEFDAREPEGSGVN